MSRHLPPETTTRPVGSSAALGHVVGYWQGLRTGAGIPARADIDPNRLRPYLGQSGIMERTPQGAVKLRVAGHGFFKLMGMEPSGMPLRALFHVHERDRLQALVAEMLEAPNLLTLSLMASQPNTSKASGQMVLMPLADMKGAATRALILLTVGPGRIVPPCRFTIRHAELTPLTAPEPVMHPTGIRVERSGKPRLTVIEGGRR